MSRERRHFVPMARGESAVITLPYSEVCMHLRVAGKTRIVRLSDDGCTADILDTVTGKPWTLTILASEAGISYGKDGYRGECVEVTDE